MAVMSRICTLALVAGTLAGCAGSPAPERPAIAATPSAEPTPTSTTLSPTPTPPPTTAAELPTAADGTDVAACKDGSCQILVTGAVDVPVRNRVLDLTLENGVVTVSTSTGSSSMVMTLTTVGGGISMESPNSPTIIITLDGIRPDAAVLRIQPG
jgi:hypothetical protein